MAKSDSGSYPIERRAGEIDRLRVQGEAMAPDTQAMLDRFGPMEGWKCLDIGCGPGGITDILGDRVGATGHVVGLDMDAEFIEYARANAQSNVEFKVDNAYSSGLPSGTFDLVHMRFVASTSGNHKALLREICRLARPNGIVALQEPDGSTLNCYPPCQAFEKLKAALLGAFKGVGADIELAKQLYFLVHQAGLRDVQYRTSLLAVRSMDPMVDYLPATVESIRGAILKLGLIAENDLSRLIADCREHLAKPGTSFTLFTLAQVWGRTEYRARKLDQH
jgi:SAM-dependent methyltransferase